MTEPIFARSRYVYDSYTDFWRLVALSGFTACFSDEMEWADDSKTYIMTPLNGEFLPFIERKHEKRCTLIWWNLEPTDGVSPEERMKHPAVPLFDDIWVSDRWVASQHPAWRHAVMGGHLGLAHPWPTLPPIRDYSFAHLCAAWGRREGMIHQLQGLGVAIAPTHGLFAEAASPFLHKSRAMLAMHQYARMPIIAPLRFAMAAAHGLPLVSEECTDYFPHTPGHDILPRPFEAQSFARALDFLRQDGMAAQMAAALQHKLHDVWSFRAGVEDALHRRTLGCKYAEAR